MINIERLYKLAVDTTEHKKIVMDNCLKMAQYLMDNGRIDDAIKLLKRGATHDDSKFDPEEFQSLASILNSDTCFTNAASKLTEAEEAAIKHHWKNNRHHPEYFSNQNNMEELDIIEMVCDWYARSIQYKTEFIPFISERMKNRFKFDDAHTEIIMKYCNLIQEL